MMTNDSCDTINDDNNKELLYSLFSIIKAKKPVEEKIKIVQAYLNKDIDINATDNMNYTLLQVAANYGETQIFELLLEKGASLNIKIKNNHTITDLDQLPHTPKAAVQSSIFKKNDKLSHDIPHSSKNRKNLKDINSITREKHLNYKKRKGTSGISGQLYETKLLSLILFRALYGGNITEFLLGTHIKAIEAFRSIVLRYKIDDNRCKIIFIQTKHKDDILSTNLLTDDSLFENSGDFSLYRYLMSYFEIKQKILSNDNNVMFRGSTIDYKFVIFTSANECLSAKKAVEDCELKNIVNTNEHGRIFQLNYNDVNSIDNMLLKLPTLLINKFGEIFWEKLKQIQNNRCNFRHVMQNEFIKIYHVFLEQNVIEIVPSTTKNDLPSTYSTGKFRKSFLSSCDENLSILRTFLFKNIKNNKRMKSDVDVENFMNSLTLEMPVAFGNVSFKIPGNEEKRQQRMKYICSLMQKILDIGCVNNSKYIIIKLNDKSVGPDQILVPADLQPYRLGGLVGNLLINDDESGMLRFNLKEQNLSEDSIYILQHLRENYDLEKTRLDITIYNFPKISLINKKCDRDHIKDFLDNLIFYSNQLKEDAVEELLKKEISCLYTIKPSDLYSKEKCDTLFLKFHDLVQKWWKKTTDVSYLNESCIYFQRAEYQILHWTLLNVVNFWCGLIIARIPLIFRDDAVNALKIDWFMKIEERIMIITSDQIDFTSVKLQQYIEKSEIDNCLFFNLDLVIRENCLEIAISELKNSNVPILILICSSNGVNNGDNNETIKHIIELFKGKVIIISSGEANLMIKFPHNIFQEDNNNSFSSLSSKCRRTVRKHAYVIFQGKKVKASNLFDKKCFDFLGPDFILNFIQNKKYIIGDTLLNCPSYVPAHNYIPRRICRYLKLDKSIIENNSTNIRVVTEEVINLSMCNEKDVVLITQSEEKYEEMCSLNEKKNIHWFAKCPRFSVLEWKQSKGYLGIIARSVDRGICEAYKKKVITIYDVPEKIVIVSGGPGMGKSTLSTQLAINTKLSSPDLWILKINLQEYIEQFMKWKTCTVDLTETMVFLYGIVDSANFKKNDHLKMVSKFVSVEKINEICLDDKINLSYTQSQLRVIKLFNYMYNNRKLAIFLDGFDEICPHCPDEVIQMLKILKSSRVIHLWLFTRPCSALNRLELELDTFSYRLVPFDEWEQRAILYKSWCQNLGLDKSLEIFCKEFVDIFRSLTTSNFLLSYFDCEFMGIPLHLKIIAKIYESYCREYINSASNRFLKGDALLQIEDKIRKYNLTTIYEEFIRTKFFEIRLGEKSSQTIEKSDMTFVMEELYEFLVESIKKMAAFNLLDPNILSTEYELPDVEALKNKIITGQEKTGIVECLDGDKIDFVHYTFAEYFTVEFLFDKLRHKNCPLSLWQYFMNDVLLSDKFGMRRFINSKLQSDSFFIQELKDNLNVTIVHELLLAQHLKFPTDALTIAVVEKLDHIDIFLLQCVESSITIDDLDKFIKLITGKTCVFCIAVGKARLPVVEIILKIVIELNSDKLKDLFYCYNTSNCLPQSPLMFALFTDSSSEIIFNHLISYDTDLIVDLFTLKAKYQDEKNTLATSAHFLAKNGHLMKNCYKFLEKLNREQLLKIFSVQNFKRQTPLHIAGKQADSFFFYSVYELLGEEEFRKICVVVDEDECNPIDRLMCPLNKIIFDPESCSKDFYELIQIIYKKSEKDVTDFNKKSFLHDKTGTTVYIRIIHPLVESIKFDTLQK